MAYFGLMAHSSGLGCGSGCSCKPCQAEHATMAEVYEPDPLGPPELSGYVGTRVPVRRTALAGYGASVTAGSGAATSAPPPATATGCRTPVRCPATTGLVTTASVAGKPLEAVESVRLDPATRLKVAVPPPPRAARSIRVLPQVEAALGKFVRTMDRFAMPVEAILIGDSQQCRCVHGTSRLSSHADGDAIDLVGVRWPQGSAFRPQRETIVHNWADLSGERTLLRRINACLRLSFANVIDYHRSDHRDHFHCDTHHGQPRKNGDPITMTFVQEALAVLLRRPFPITGRLDAATQQGLREFSRISPSTSLLEHRAVLDKIFDNLFAAIASGPGGTGRN